MDADTRAIVSELQNAQRAQSNGRPGNNRLLDGLSSSLTTKLELLSRNRLLELREREANLLQNENLIATLPDKGAKLRASIAQINALLEDQKQKEKDSSWDNDARERILNRANSEAEQFDRSSSLLHPKKSEDHPSKTRMMRLDDSMKLQNEHQQHIKEEKLKRQMEALGLGAVGNSNRGSISESLADDLSLSMERMKLNPELGPHRPQDDDSDEYEEGSEDEYSNSDGLYDDDEGFEEEDNYYES